ncbi:MAG: GHKL domain-containing protein [Lacrimispora saccharolytica]
MSLLYQGDTMTQVDRVSILKWQIYVFVILLKALYAVIVYRLLKNFKYEIQAKDATVLSISFLLVFAVSFASTYGYLNLGESNTLILDVVTSVLGVVFIVQFLYSRNVSYLREQEQRDKMQIAQLQQQYAYYSDKLKDEERIRSIYHDLKNHLLVMESRQNTEETRRMAETLRSQIADYEDYVHTGNGFLDIILKDKAAKAREKQIDFSAVVDFHGIDFLEPLDISTIFGNAIDNAIEASENLPEYKRLITVRAERVRDMLIITVENNTAPGNHLVEGTTKKDHFVHGFGISNIKKAVEKYGGQCSFQQEERMYRLKILIPIP